MNSLAEWFYPAKCALCGNFDPEPLCPVCLSRYRRVEPSTYAGTPPLTAEAALFRYEGRAAQAVQRLKYERVTAHAAQMASQMATHARDLGLDSLDAVVPVPIHWTRLNWRGFNQAELLAEAMPRVQPWLTRIRRTRPQVGLSPDERQSNLIGAFRADPAVLGKSILLVDDVRTSGGTACECARALCEAGAAEVVLLTYAAGASASDQWEEPGTP